LFNTLPANVPINEDNIRASDEPINTCHIEFDFEASIIVESCVLSPSSARNTSINVVIIVLINLHSSI